MTAPDPLAPIRARAEGLTDLCPEHLGQSVRHVQRNCDIECYAHAGDYSECNQPDRYAGERMAKALADIPALLAALDAVLALAEKWRYKGEFGWGPWQEGYGPDPEGHFLDRASAELRAAVSASLGGVE